MADTERFRSYLRARLQERGISRRQLSLALGRDASYITQLLDPPSGTSRALPSPAELRIAAPLLDVPLIDLLELAWGISRAELEADLQTIAAHRGAWAKTFDELSSAEREEVSNFVAYVKAKRAQAKQEAAAAQGSTADQEYVAHAPRARRGRAQ